MREANHIEFCRMKNVLDEILQMHRNSELNNILKLLMDPTSVATGLKIDFDTFVSSNSFCSIYFPTILNRYFPLLVLIFNCNFNEKKLISYVGKDGTLLNQ